MAQSNTLNAVGTTIGVAILALAFVAAPYSCEWGLEAYIVFGAAAVAALFAAPLVMRTDLSAGRRAVFALFFALVGGGVWLLGLFAANMRIICRLI